VPRETRKNGSGRRRAKAPPGYMSIPVWGKKYWDLGRTASYAAARRGEVPTVTIGQDWVPPNWEELVQARAINKMEERAQEHSQRLASSPSENHSDIPTEASALSADADPAGRRMPKGHRPRRTPQQQSGPSHTV
jgi:hypothetical protein